MTHATGIARQIGIGLVVLTLTLSGLLLQPAQVLAGVGGSPGAPGLNVRCASGDHVPEATLVSRKAGKGQLEYL